MNNSILFLKSRGIRSALAAVLSAASLAGCGASPRLELGQRVTAAAVAPANSGCGLSFPTANICASLAWLSEPVVGKASSFRLQFKSTTDSQPIELTNSLAVQLWMPMMGHGSAPVTITHAQGAGSVGAYDVTNAYFVMGGMWEIHVRLTNGTTVLDEAVAQIQL